MARMRPPGSVIQNAIRQEMQIPDADGRRGLRVLDRRDKYARILAELLGWRTRVYPTFPPVKERVAPSLVALSFACHGFLRKPDGDGLNRSW